MLPQQPVKTRPVWPNHRGGSNTGTDSGLFIFLSVYPLKAERIRLGIYDRHASVM